MLEDNYVPSPRDRSKISRRLPKIECHFTLDKHDIERLESIVEEYQKDMTYSNKLKMSVHYPTSIVQSVKIIEESSSLSREISFNIPIEVNLEAIVCKAKDIATIPVEATLDIGTAKVSLREVGLTEKGMIAEEYLPLFDDYPVESIRNDLVARMKEALLPVTPKAIFWAFDEKFLLPSEIEYESFILGGDRYNNSAPLYHDAVGRLILKNPPKSE
jgi:hypothetical protein